MREKAGDYDYTLTRLVRSVTRATNGQEEQTFTAQAGYLWAGIEENAGRRQTDYGATQTGADAVIRVRGWPTLSALDRLQDSYGRVWIVENIARSKTPYELRIEAHRFDALTLSG